MGGHAEITSIHRLPNARLDVQPSEPGLNRAAWVAGSLSTFADPDSWSQVLKFQASDLAIAVVTSGVRPEDLRACLTSLQSAAGFSPGRVLVIQEIVGEASYGGQARQVVETEFGFAWTQHQATESSETAGAASRYRFALEHALKMHFRGARSLLVIDEGVVLSHDALWYFAQLEPLLHQDLSIWCVTSWNDNGLAPYVADPTVLMRTDWFSGISWLVRAELLDELLPNWP